MKAYLFAIFLLATLFSCQCKGEIEEPFMSFLPSQNYSIKSVKGIDKNGIAKAIITDPYKVPINMAKDEVFYIVEGLLNGEKTLDTLQFVYQRKLIYDEAFCGGSLELDSFKVLKTSYKAVEFETFYISKSAFAQQKKYYHAIISK
jgi:hypothetical protein